MRRLWHRACLSRRLHVAMRMNANLIFKWMKGPRFSPATGKTPDAPEGGGVFLPVQISGPTIDQRADETTVRTAGSASALLLAHRVDITLSDGRRVVVEGPMPLSSVVGLVQGLMV